MSNEVQRNNVNQVQVQSNTAPKARGRIVGKNNAEEVATNTNSTVNVSSALHSRGAAAAFLECKAGVALPTSSFKNYVGKQEAAIGSLYKSHENEYDKLLKKYEDLEDLLITLGKAKEDKIEKIRCEIGKLNNEIRKINLEVRRIYRKITSTICNVDSMAKAWRNSEKDSSLKKQGEEAINNFNRICTKYSSRESEKLQKQLKNSEEDIKDINEEIEMADEEIDGIEHILSFGSKNDRAVVDLQGYSREEVKEKGLLPYAKSKREISTKILKTLQKKEKSIGEKARAFEGDQNTIGKLAFDEVKSDATDVALTLELPDGATVNRGGNASDLLKELMNNAIARRGEIEGKIAETKKKYAWYGIGTVEKLEKQLDKININVLKLGKDDSRVDAPTREKANVLLARYDDTRNRHSKIEEEIRRLGSSKIDEDIYDKMDDEKEELEEEMDDISEEVNEIAHKITEAVTQA